MDAEVIRAHLSAIAADGHERMTPRSCSLCRAALEAPELASLVAKIAARGSQDTVSPSSRGQKGAGA